MTASEIREYVCGYMQLNDVTAPMLARQCDMPVSTVRHMLKYGEYSGLQNWERVLDAIGVRLVVDAWKLS